jgi:hypothetical protein
MRLKELTLVAFLLPLTQLACGGADGTAAGGPGNSSKPPVAAGLIPGDAQSIVLRSTIDATPGTDSSPKCGPIDPQGVSFDDESFTLTFPARELSWRICQPTGGGAFAYQVGKKTLDDTEFVQVYDALAAVTASPSAYSADFPFETMEVTTPSATASYGVIPDGYEPSIVRVTGLDDVFVAARALAK